jgi:hypothetical protein
MRFSWTGLILAPLAVPVIFSALLSSLGGAHPVLGFLILLIPGCIVSYGSTMFLFLPCLFLLSLWRGRADTADSDGMEEQRRGFRPTHRELLHLLRALDRRSADGRIPAGRTDNSRTLLVARDAAGEPLDTRTGYSR